MKTIKIEKEVKIELENETLIVEAGDCIKVVESYYPNYSLLKELRGKELTDDESREVEKELTNGKKAIVRLAKDILKYVSDVNNPNVSTKSVDILVSTIKEYNDFLEEIYSIYGM